MIENNSDSNLVSMGIYKESQTVANKNLKDKTKNVKDKEINIPVTQYIKIVKNNQLKITDKTLLLQRRWFVGFLGPPGAGKSTLCNTAIYCQQNQQEYLFKTSPQGDSFTKGLWILSHEAKMKFANSSEWEVMDLEGFQADEEVSWSLTMIISVLAEVVVFCCRDPRAANVYKALDIFKKGLNLTKELQMKPVTKQAFVIITPTLNKIKTEIFNRFNEQLHTHSIEINIVIIPNIDEDDENKLPFHSDIVNPIREMIKKFNFDPNSQSAASKVNQVFTLLEAFNKKDFETCTNYAFEYFKTDCERIFKETLAKHKSKHVDRAKQQTLDNADMTLPQFVNLPNFILNIDFQSSQFYQAENENFALWFNKEYSKKLDIEAEIMDIYQPYYAVKLSQLQQNLALAECEQLKIEAEQNCYKFKEEKEKLQLEHDEYMQKTLIEHEKIIEQEEKLKKERENKLEAEKLMQANQVAKELEAKIKQKEHENKIELEKKEALLNAEKLQLEEEYKRQMEEKRKSLLENKSKLEEQHRIQMQKEVEDHNRKMKEEETRLEEEKNIKKEEHRKQLELQEQQLLEETKLREIEHNKLLKEEEERLIELKNKKEKELKAKLDEEQKQFEQETQKKTEEYNKQLLEKERSLATEKMRIEEEHKRLEQLINKQEKELIEKKTRESFKKLESECISDAKVKLLKIISSLEVKRPLIDEIVRTLSDDNWINLIETNRINKFNEEHNTHYEANWILFQTEYLAERHELKVKWEAQIEQSKWKAPVAAKGDLKCKNDHTLNADVVICGNCHNDAGQMYWCDGPNKVAICKNGCPPQKVGDKLICRRCKADALCTVRESSYFP